MHLFPAPSTLLGLQKVCEGLCLHHEVERLVVFIFEEQQIRFGLLRGKYWCGTWSIA